MNVIFHDYFFGVLSVLRYCVNCQYFTLRGIHWRHPRTLKTNWMLNFTNFSTKIVSICLYSFLVTILIIHNSHYQVKRQVNFENELCGSHRDGKTSLQNLINPRINVIKDVISIWLSPNFEGIVKLHIQLKFKLRGSYRKGTSFLLNYVLSRKTAQLPPNLVHVLIYHSYTFSVQILAMWIP